MAEGVQWCHRQPIAVCGQRRFAQGRCVPALAAPLRKMPTACFGYGSPFRKRFDELQQGCRQIHDSSHEFHKRTSLLAKGAAPTYGCLRHLSFYLNKIAGKTVDKAKVKPGFSYKRVSSSRSGLLGVFNRLQGHSFSMLRQRSLDGPSAHGSSRSDEGLSD